ncbi:rhamnulokinase [Aureimonas pseudogalii]|uniref:Rhamnulokinase n=1 Tax=Aureimonas pseudogalii TaxID=1744844 RepID=A0A7W6H6L0_9HYPH|nr:FGGY family carbohydrate kinase [Aureimonas pseudogalii]MBB3999512.1 rhamnulokinase [Aureimonas pseudogalii]
MRGAGGANRALVLDLGGGSARAMLAECGEGGAIALTELHRFSGYETRVVDGPAWDLDALFGGVEAGLAAAAAAGRIGSIGVDGWGVDFALLGADGRPLETPRTHRHPRGLDGFEALRAHHELIAARTGAQPLPIVSVFHLVDWARCNRDAAAGVRQFLMIADLVAHHLTGVAACERTLARTAGLVDLATGDWDREILALTGLPAAAFGRLVPAGTILGPLAPELAARTGLGPVPVIAVAAHDTASAALALAPGDDEAFLVAGSWNLVGAEVPDGAISTQARAAGFGLEGGVEGRGLLLRSLPGMHLLRRLRAAWARRHGADIDFPRWSALALAAPPAALVPDLSRTAFLDPPDLLAALHAECPGLSQDEPGPLARALYEGLGREVAGALDTLETCLGRRFCAVRLGGGGAQDAAFCTLVASAARRPVLAGPVEASALGNALVQFAALGRFPSIEAGRRALAARLPIRRFEPAPEEHLA